MRCSRRATASVDAFVVKIAPEGGAMIYGTYLGGLGGDYGSGIAVDTAGAAHVIGFTESADFPTMNALQPALGGKVGCIRLEAQSGWRVPRLLHVPGGQ